MPPMTLSSPSHTRKVYSWSLFDTNGFSGFHRSQFIDSEYSYTRQEMVSHSGLNYLCIDPVKTNLFLLTITDLPFILRTIDLDNSIPKSPGMVLSTEGYKGFAIPYIYFFEYKERTSRTARLHKVSKQKR